MHDLVIRGGNVVDGTGSPVGVADIAIDDGLVTSVIDDDSLTFGKPRMEWDLPGGAPRLVPKARGYWHAFVDGIETVTNDEFTGNLPGRLVRGPR